MMSDCSVANDDADSSIDCLVVGDGCIGVFIAQMLKLNRPELHIAIKGRQPSSLADADKLQHKRWVKRLCQDKGVHYLQDYAEIDGTVSAMMVTTKSDDVQQVAIELDAAGIDAEHCLLVYNGLLPPLQPDFPGLSARAIPAAGYAWDKAAASGLTVVNAQAAWPICADGDSAQLSMQFWVDLLRSCGQAAEADDSHGLRILRKYLINTAVNPLTVIYQRKVDELLDDPLTHQRMRDILSETIPIMKADDRFAAVRDSMPSDSELLRESFTFIETYRGHYTSAYHAFMAGDRIEIASLTEYAIAQGRALAMVTTENERVQADIRFALAQRDSDASVIK